MNSDAEMLLHEELKRLFEELKGKDPSSEEHKAIVDSITKLMDRGIKIDEVNLEDTKRACETNVKISQIKEDRNGRFWSYLLKFIEIGLPLYTAFKATKLVLKFEETGVITTKPGNSWISRILRIR